MMSRRRSFARWSTTLEARLLFVVLAVALTVQVFYFVRVQAIYPPEGLTTGVFYDLTARNILHHATFGFGDYPDIQKTTFRPPLYSLVLAGIYGAFGENPAFGLVFNNILLLLTVVVVYLIGRNFGPWIGVVAAALFALDPIGLITANKNGSDALFTFLMAVLVLLSLKAWSSKVNITTVALVSLVLALSSLTRAVSLYLWFPLLVSFAVAHRWRAPRLQWSRIALLMFVFLSIQGVLIGGWSARNYAVSGRADFASEKVDHVYDFFGPLVVARATGTSRKAINKELVAKLEANTEYQAMTHTEKQKYRLDKGIAMALDHPVTAARVYLEHIPAMFMSYPLSAATMFFDEDRRESIGVFMADYAAGKSSRIDVSGYFGLFRYFGDGGLFFVLAHATLYKLFYLTLMISFPIGLAYMTVKQEHWREGLLLATIGVYLVFVVGFWATGRFRMPLLPVATVAMAYLLVWGWGRLRSTWLGHGRSPVRMLTGTLSSIGRGGRRRPERQEAPQL